MIGLVSVMYSLRHLSLDVILRRRHDSYAGVVEWLARVPHSDASLRGQYLTALNHTASAVRTREYDPICPHK